MAGTIEDMEPIMSPETKRLAREVAEMAGESTDATIRKALEERKRKLVPVTKLEEGERARWMRFLEEEVWPNVDPDFLGKPISKEEMDRLAGYDPEGV